MKRYQRLTRSSDFQRVANSGKSFPSHLIVLVAATNGLDFSRVAVVASRIVGNAVQRNRAKRQLRACVDAIITSIKPGWDLVFYARQSMRCADYLSIYKSMTEVLQKANLISLED